MDCRPPGSSVHGDSPGKNTGVDCHFLLQGIFPTQGSNPCLQWLLLCRQILYHWATADPVHESNPSSHLNHGIIWNQRYEGPELKRKTYPATVHVWRALRRSWGLWRSWVSFKTSEMQKPGCTPEGHYWWDFPSQVPGAPWGAAMGGSWWENITSQNEGILKRFKWR